MQHGGNKSGREKKRERAFQWGFDICPHSTDSLEPSQRDFSSFNSVAPLRVFVRKRRFACVPARCERKSFTQTTGWGTSVSTEATGPRAGGRDKRYVKEAFVAAVEEYELLTINPAANLKLPQSPKSGGDVWTVQETKKFMEAVAENQLHSLFVFLFATGARRGEALALLWDDIDLDKGTVSINKAAQWVKGQRLIGPTKTGANRSIPIDPPTIKTLKSHRAKLAGEKIGSVHWQENNLVFCHSDGSPLRPDYPYGVFKRYSQRAGVRPIRLHDIRHTHATWLLEAGEQLHVVSERLGHADTSTTARIYAHVTVRQRQEAADTFSRIMEEG